MYTHTRAYSHTYVHTYTHTQEGGGREDGRGLEEANVGVGGGGDHSQAQHNSANKSSGARRDEISSNISRPITLISDSIFK